MGCDSASVWLTQALKMQLPSVHIPIHEQRPLAVYQFEALGRQADGSGYHVSTPGMHFISVLDGKCPVFIKPDFTYPVSLW